MPTIKGVFVTSHIRALAREKGAAAVRELALRYGKPINFKASEDVPVREEVKLIEHALDLLTAGHPVPKELRAYEAGKLHFRNFSNTPLGKLVLPYFRARFKMLMMRTGHIAGHVFRGVRFTSEDIGRKSVRITMENNDYPVDHFKGFFGAWLEYAGLVGSVEASAENGDRYVYSIAWN